MPTFDRFDICEAYWCLENDWNSGGVLWERPSCTRKRESVGVLLHRVQFKPRPDLEYTTLSENGKQIYQDAIRTFGLDIGNSGYCNCACPTCFEGPIMGIQGVTYCDDCVSAGCMDPSTRECLREPELEEYERDEDPDEPSEDDWTTSDHVTFYQYGRVIMSLEGRDCTEHEMWAHILSAMSAANFWPNVWFISDHGNAHLMRDPRKFDPITGVLK